MIGKDFRPLGGFAALTALIALGWLVTAGPLAGTTPPILAPPAIAGTGQVAGPPGGVIYNASCAACHGSKGTGTANGPDLTASGAAAIDFMVRTGRMPLSAPGAPVIAGRPAFNEAEIQALVDYAASLGDGPPIPNVQVTGATDLAAGRAAYVATCAACHGAGATGDAVGGGAIAPSLLDTAPTQVAEAIRVGPGEMPAFGTSQISDEQLNEIAGYLLFLRSDAAAPGGQTVGGVGPVAEGYVAWIAYAVGLLLVARWIERRRRHG